MRKWNHNSLQADLAKYLRTTKGVIAWEDMQLGPAGSPRPDVYTIPPSYSKFRPLAYEIKVSVADFRRDVTAGKWQDYLKFACGVVFAAPKGLISKADLPAGCGLIMRGDSGWRMAKAPTLSPLNNLPRDAWVKLVIDGIKRQGEVGREIYRAKLSGYSAERALVKRHGEHVASLVAKAISAEDSLQRAIENQEQAAKEVLQETHRHIQLAAERAERATAALNREQRDMASALGLDGDTSLPELTRAMRDAVARIAQDSEVQRLRRLFDSIQRDLERATKPLPGESTPHPHHLEHEAS